MLQVVLHIRQRYAVWTLGYKRAYSTVTTLNAAVPC